jgi:hypothetical protein
VERFKAARLLTFIDRDGVRVKMSSTQYVPRSSRCAFFADGAEQPVFAEQMTLQIKAVIMFIAIGFGGLGVACWPLVPKFAGSNPAEAVEFLRAKKSSAHLPSEGK